MTFNEKSAWIMVTALLISGSGYLSTLVSLSDAAGGLVDPSLAPLVRFTVVIIAVAIVGHALVALLRPNEAHAPLDERERQLTERAGNWSGILLGAGVITALISYLILRDGSVLFYLAFASLYIAQLAEYLLQLVLIRRAS